MRYRKKFTVNIKKIMVDNVGRTIVLRSSSHIMLNNLFYRIPEIYDFLKLILSIVNILYKEILLCC